MPDSTPDVWEQLKGSLGDLKDSFTFSQDSSVLAMVVYLLMGGLLALYIRFLYRRCNASVSDSDSVARIFPLLTMVTIGVIAVTAHHEIVLGIIGGLFVVEAMSVIIQVFFYKRTGKRIFRMAPIHHHFEQLGWAEPTVVIRFWIIAFVLALAGLATLKLR